jgi:cytochrome c peroxidase
LASLGRLAAAAGFLLSLTSSAAAQPPSTDAQVELGRRLFYDRRLSVNGEMSCASCHRQELAFTDGRPRAVGATGEVHPRSTMSLANVADEETLGWDDPNLTRLEDQALVPLLNEDPVEMGLAGHEPEVLERLRAEPEYAELLADSDGLDAVVNALAAFERTLISDDSPFDRWLRRDEPLPAAARRGMRLFFSPRLGCAGCHRGSSFAGRKGEFHNTGLYNEDGEGAYPPGSEGLMRHTGHPDDMGRFRAPTLRNIAVTAPYMHDGSVGTLDQAIGLYARGGRTASPLKDEQLKGFELTTADAADLLAFLEALTDRAFLEDPRFSNPW